MSTISPGPASNSGTPANAFEVRAVDSAETGKLTSTDKGVNAASPANAFEKRAVESGGIQH